MKQEHFTTEFLSYLRVLPEDHNPSSSYTVIILLHGYGSHMGDLAGLAPMINATDFVYKVLLGGFSQGGMMTLHYGLLRPDRFSGAIALSSKILDKTYLSTNIKTMGKLPIYISHGTLDQVIPVSEGRSTNEFLLEVGYEVDYYEYTMGHAISSENIADLQQWLNQFNCKTNK